MPRGQKDKLYRNFSKGLITEAGFLTYPEDSSTDELNTIIYRKGNRTRRLGMDFEEGTPGTDFDDLDSTTTMMEYFWRAPGDKSAVNFVVQQVDHRLWFFDASATPLSAGLKPFHIDLTEFASPASTLDQIRSTPVSLAGGKGYLFVASEFIDPSTVVYDPVADTIEHIRVRILVRDFDGVNDGLPNDSEPGSLSSEHLYNLRNQGWVPPGSASVQTSLPGEAPAGGAEITAPGSGTTGGGGEGSYDDFDYNDTYYDPYSGEERFKGFSE